MYLYNTFIYIYTYINKNQLVDLISLNLIYTYYFGYIIN